jgi:hypothetical protein
MTLRLLLFLTAIAPLAGQAQNMLGLTTSRYAGTNATYLNPSSAANSPYRHYVNLATVNVHVDNNYVRYRAPYSILSVLSGTVPRQFYLPNGSLDFRPDYTEEILDGQPKNGNLWGDGRGPAVMLPIGKTGRLTLSTRLRAVAQVTGASENLLSALRTNLDAPSLLSIPSRVGAFNLASNTYSEMAVSYARPVWENTSGRLLVGVTIKRLTGLSAGYLVNRGLTFQLGSDPETNQGTLTINNIDADLGFTTHLNKRTLDLETLLDHRAPGRGWGADIGLTYLVGNYLQLGLAINDIGGIQYSINKAQAYTLTRSNVTLRSTDFERVSGTEAILGTLRDKLQPTDATDGFDIGLPAAFTFTADYQTDSPLGFSAVYIQDRQGIMTGSIRQPMLMAVTPRYENRHFGLSIPLLYMNHGMSVGMSLRAGPLTLGSDNLLGFFGTDKNGLHPRGVDVYVGLAMGIGEVTDN